jgi:hypothetical protein
MQGLNRTLAVLGAALVLAVVANGVAVAATGQGFVLGRHNAANKATTLARTTSGPALQVRTASTANAPFIVNGRGRVANLNADKVDGLDAERLRHQVLSFEISPAGFTGSSFAMTLPLPAGRYAASYTATFDGIAGYTFCWLEQSRETGDPEVQQKKVLGEDIYQGDNLAALNGNGVVTVAADTEVSLVCQSDQGDLQWSATQPVQVHALRIDAGGPTRLLTFD